MTENRNNGGPAFPQHDLSGYGIGPAMDGDRYLVGGMALRDWFAGQAMAALIIANGGHSCALGLGSAKDAYKAADAMLEARLLATRSSSKEA